MKIAAVVAMSSFPMWRKTLGELCKVADEIYIRWDSANGDPEIPKYAPEICGKKLKTVFVTNNPWIVPDWREECLQLVYSQKCDADILLWPDEDEIFGTGFREELDNFWRSGKDAIMFDYHPLESDDGRQINGGVPYPPDPHMKACRLIPGLSFFPYHGDGKIAKYHRPESWFLAKTKIHHFAAYTKGLQESKHWRSNTPTSRGVKAVTILGFGPSSKGVLGPNGNQLQRLGEIWSLNDCYNTFPPDVMKNITRIFEMHKFGPRTGGHWDKMRDWLAERPETARYLVDGQLEDRNKKKAPDGRTHVWHLDRLAKEGRRIILQEPHPEILGSETYPLQQVIHTLGIDFFAGSPAYLLAMAILEGYTHIRIYGLDQTDWEHTLQRLNFASWVHFAKGRGIRVDGALTFLNPFTKHYGYDMAPEWGPYQEELLWLGHPMVVRYKHDSRVVGGDFARTIGG